MQREVRVAEKFPGQYYNIGILRSDNFVSLRGLRNQADSTRQDARLAPHRFREWNLKTRRKRHLLMRYHVAGRTDDQVDAGRLRRPR